MQRLIGLVLMVAGVLTSFACHAWDDEPGCAAPTIQGQFSGTVRFDRAHVFWDGQNVRIQYRGVSSSAVPHASVMTAFPAVFGWQGVAADYPDLHFPEMTMSLNGLSLPHRGLAVAFLDGVDVTARLQSSGISPLLVAHPEPVSDGWAHRRGADFFSRTAGQAFPLWLLGYRHIWRLPPLDKGPQVIEVAYRGRPEKAELPTESKRFESLVAAHCGDVTSVKARLRDLFGALPEAMLIRRLQVPLSLAGSVEPDGLLTVNSGTAPSKVLTLACGPQDASLVGAPSMQSVAVTHGRAVSLLMLSPLQ